jgi:hypothetical protein
MAITSDATLLDEALGYIYYYNNLREHSSLANQTPFDCLRKHLPDVDEAIRYVHPLLLDTASVSLGPWSGYYVLTQNPNHCCVPVKYRRMKKVFAKKTIKGRKLEKLKIN